MTAQADHLEELGSCRSLAEAAKVQAAFAAEAMADYGRIAVRMVGDARDAIKAEDAPPR